MDLLNVPFQVYNFMDINPLDLYFLVKNKYIEIKKNIFIFAFIDFEFAIF